MKTRNKAELRLSPRETEILSLIAGGLENKEIAVELKLAPGTIRTHVERILMKLCAVNRAHAVAIGIRSNLI